MAQIRCPPLKKLASTLIAASMIAAWDCSWSDEFPSARKVISSSEIPIRSPLAAASSDACRSAPPDAEVVSKSESITVFCMVPPSKIEGGVQERVLRAFATARVVYLGPGTYHLQGTLRLPDNKHLIGSGSQSVQIKAIRRFDESRNIAPFNMIVMGNSSSIEGVTVSGLYSESGFASDPAKIVPASGVLFRGNYSAAIDVVSTDHNGQAFAIGADDPNNAPHDNRISFSEGNDCGHRGLNISAGSYNNTILNFSSRNCARAGFLLGYGAHSNSAINLRLEGCGNACLWVHMGSHHNSISNVTITSPNAAAIRANSPQMIVGAGAHDNRFYNFSFNGAADRAVYIWNQRVDHPELGTVDGPIEGNVFRGFRITGTKAGGGRAIVFRGDPHHRIVKNIFSAIVLSNYDVPYQDESSIVPEKFLPPISEIKTKP